jgi:hypothetical protein
MTYRIRSISTLAKPLIALGAFLLTSLVSSRHCSAEDKERYFYKGYDYGSQALYNPLYVFINGAYDVLQIRAGNRDITERSFYTNDLPNVAKNLFVHPFRSVSEEGWSRFMRQEIFPLSYRSDTARWVPNYSLHLFGGGMTYRALSEWYDDHSVPVPWLWSAATVLGYGFINETVENKGVNGRNTDAIADFWFFDIGGIVLFSFPSVCRFFSKTVIVSDWSLQPSFTYPGFDLHNHGQYFSFKYPLPFYDKLRVFSWLGMAQLFGLSYKMDSGYSVSAAGGTMDTRFVNDTGDSVHNSVQFRPSGALFLDRNESLLASLQVSNVQDYFALLNLYPNAFWKTNPGVGFWGVTDKQGHVIVGLSLSSLGLGAGFGSLK